MVAQRVLVILTCFLPAVAAISAGCAKPMVQNADLPYGVNLSSVEGVTIERVARRTTQAQSFSWSETLDGTQQVQATVAGPIPSVIKTMFDLTESQIQVGVRFPPGTYDISVETEGGWDHAMDLVLQAIAETFGCAAIRTTAWIEAWVLHPPAGPIHRFASAKNARNPGWSDGGNSGALHFRNFHNLDWDAVASEISMDLDEPVVNETGLDGHWSGAYRWRANRPHTLAEDVRARGIPMTRPAREMDVVVLAPAR